VSSPAENLGALRASIDRTDDEIMRLLNDRARLVAQVAQLKERQNLPFYVPSREKQIVDRLQGANQGPFPTDAIRPVFQEIMSACLSLEQTVRVAYLGPEATFTHMAVKRQFGLSARTVPVGTIAGVFDEVERGSADFGVVPIENSAEGVVTHTLDTFVDSELKIAAEIVMEVSHCLLVRAGLEPADVERVYSHPQALAQCRRWLGANLPRAVCVEAASTAEAARLARDDARGAAIASELAARLYDLMVARRKLEDMAENRTRFLVIGKRQAQATGRDKTSILFAIKDEAGKLFHVLEPLAKAGLNLSKIESRPSRRRPWEYVFFVDVDGHAADAPLAAVLAEVKGGCELFKILGSYPRAESV
jgi:chorismate mutase/prephenate dehydratase